MGDSVINRAHIFERSNKGSNVLESSSSDDSRCWVLQESEVQILETLVDSVQRTHFRDLSYNISTSFSHFFFFVFGQSVIKRENLDFEAVERNVFGNIYQVFDNCGSDMGSFIKTESSEFFDDIVFA